jgi:translin
MSDLDRISDQIRMEFDRKTARRDAALAQARQLTRHASLAIRAIHREDEAEAERELESARELARDLREGLKADPDLYFAGYTQDALKEFVEAELTVALILNHPLVLRTSTRNTRPTWPAYPRRWASCAGAAWTCFGRDTPARWNAC